MGIVTIEESADERSLVCPGLRLRFRWTGDRWTHAIDLGPGPEPDPSWPSSGRGADGRWLVLAEAVEWEAPETNPGAAAGPVFQELHFQEDEGGAHALLVGKAGSHHFSGSFRVADRAEELLDRVDSLDGLIGYLPMVDVDIAVRSSVPISSLATSYRIQNPLRGYPLTWSPDDSELSQDHGVLWESGSGIPGHDFKFEGYPPSRLFLTGGDYGPWVARLVVGLDPGNRTQRYTYRWWHDCTTRHFRDLWRSRDPAYDALLRRNEAEDEAQRERIEAEIRRDPELQAWFQRFGIDPDSL